MLGDLMFDRGRILQRIMTRLAGLMAAMVVGWALALGLPAMAQQGDDADAFTAQAINKLYDEGKYAEAIPLAQQYVAITRQRNGEESMEFGTAISWLAAVYQAQGRYAFAEPLYERALAIWEKALGPDH